jgi:hypothetical protein
MDDFDIIWQGSVVGRLTNVDAETITVAVEGLRGQLKCEGHFVAAPGSIAEEFARRLQALEKLDVTTPDDRTPRTIYWRGHDRAKVAWRSSRSPITWPARHCAVSDPADRVRPHIVALR